MRKLTVLISSAGRRAQLLGCFRESARVLGVELKVLAADIAPEMSSACHLADCSFKVPGSQDRGFIDSVYKICVDEGVDLVIPTIDTELAAFSAASEMFANSGVLVSISDQSVIALARDKLWTARALCGSGVSVPKSVSAKEFLEDPSKIGWPVIVKPLSGSSSKGIAVPGSLPEAVSIAREVPGVMVQDLVMGQEYTVNCYVDWRSRLMCAVPHRRIEIRGGEVAKGVTERTESLRQAATGVARCLPGARGPFCFQGIVAPDGRFVVFEINARFGGGYPLAHRAGATFTQWLLEETLGLPCTAHDNWKPGVTMLRYDDAVFIDP